MTPSSAGRLESVSVLRDFIHFLGWALPNVAMALLQILALLFIFWVARKQANSEIVLSNCVLLFYSTALFGTTFYSLLKRPDDFLTNKSLLFLSISIMLIIFGVTVGLYVWNVLVAHDPQISLKPSWDRRRDIEFLVTGLVILFSYFTSGRS